MPETDPDKPWGGNLTLGSLQGPWVGPAKCLQEHAIGNRPPIPYGETNANQDMASLVEEGFKPLRGLLTEGRYVVFESDDQAIEVFDDGHVGVGNANRKHDKISQRWILHSYEDYGKQFYLQSAKTKGYVQSNGKLTKDKKNAELFTIEYYPNEAKYTLDAGARKRSGGSQKRGALDWTGGGSYFSAFSVSYQS